MNNDNDNDNYIDTELDYNEIDMPATIDITPSWEATARMLIAILEGSSTTESVEFAKSEIIRMGKIIDQQQEK